MNYSSTNQFDAFWAQRVQKEENAANGQSCDAKYGGSCSLFNFCRKENKLHVKYFQECTKR